jgi:hypothetical protein
MHCTIIDHIHIQGELDYALSHASRTQGTSPATADLQSQSALMAKATEPLPLSPAEMPHLFDIILHIIFHLFLLALCVLSLVALWSLTSRGSFAVFLMWTLAFYVSLFLCAWYGRPRQSILTVFISAFELHRCLHPSQLQVLCPYPLSTSTLSQQMLEGHMCIINHRIVQLGLTMFQSPMGVLEV